MAKEQFRMDSSQIARIMGTVGSPLIVISELLKNAVDASARNINISYNLTEKTITVENDYAIAYLYRAILESSTKYLSRRQTKVQYKETALETSITNALNYIGDQSQKNKQINMKTVRTWRDTVTNRKLIDTLNQYIHNEQPVDALLLQETWNTMKGYIITCLTLQ